MRKERDTVSRRNLLKAAGVGIAGCSLLSGAVSATDELDQMPTFTQEELEDEDFWRDSRSHPSGGVESVSAFNRDFVARIGIDSDNPTADRGDGFFWRTEGRERFDMRSPEERGEIDDIDELHHYGTAIHVDLYMDPEWEDRAVRAGMWTAGWGEDGSRTNYFGIIEFTTAETETISTSPDQSEVSKNERWRIWHPITGWIDLPTEVSYGEWVRLETVLDFANTLFCRRLLILLSCRCGIEESKDTASAVSVRHDSARCVWLGIGRSGPVGAGSLA